MRSQALRSSNRSPGRRTEMSATCVAVHHGDDPTFEDLTSRDSLGPPHDRHTEPAFTQVAILPQEDQPVGQVMGGAGQSFAKQRLTSRAVPPAQPPARPKASARHVVQLQLEQTAAGRDDVLSTRIPTCAPARPTGPAGWPAMLGTPPRVQA